MCGVLFGELLLRQDSYINIEIINSLGKLMNKDYCLVLIIII